MQKQNSKVSKVPYAWVILAVLYVGGIASFGMRATIGAYISPWEQDFAVNRAVITSISMLNFITAAIAQPLVGKLNDYFGKSIVPSAGVVLMGCCLLLTSQANQIWQVFVLYGVGFSLGVTCCSNVVAMSAIANWFVEKRGFALGLVTSGMAVGQLIFVPVNLFMIRQLGWRNTMAALSIIIMIICGPLYAIYLRSKPQEKGMKPYGYTESANETQAPRMTETAKSLPVLGVLKERAFWLLTIPYFICGFTDVGLIQTHFIPISEGKGFSLSSVAIASSLVAALNIVGSIVTGHLSDHFNRKRQLGVIYMIRALTFIFLIVLQRPWLLLIFAVVYGAMEMATIAPTNSLTVQLFEKYSIGAVIGLVSVSHQLGGAVGSWAPGLLFDLTGSYSTTLILSAALLLGVALLAQKTPERD